MASQRSLTSRGGSRVSAGTFDAVEGDLSQYGNQNNTLMMSVTFPSTPPLPPQSADYRRSNTFGSDSGWGGPEGRPPSDDAWILSRRSTGSNASAVSSSQTQSEALSDIWDRYGLWRVGLHQQSPADGSDDWEAASRGASYESGAGCCCVDHSHQQSPLGRTAAWVHSHRNPAAAALEFRSLDANYLRPESPGRFSCSRRESSRSASRSRHRSRKYRSRGSHASSAWNSVESHMSATPPYRPWGYDRPDYCDTSCARRDDSWETDPDVPSMSPMLPHSTQGYHCPNYNDVSHAWASNPETFMYTAPYTNPGHSSPNYDSYYTRSDNSWGSNRDARSMSATSPYSTSGYDCLNYNDPSYARRDDSWAAPESFVYPVSSYSTWSYGSSAGNASYSSTASYHNGARSVATVGWVSARETTTVWSVPRASHLVVLV